VTAVSRLMEEHMVIADANGAKGKWSDGKWRNGVKGGGGSRVLSVCPSGCGGCFDGCCES